MIGIIVTGHGEFAKGIGQATKMIAGPQEAFEIVPFQEDESIEELRTHLISTVDSLKKETEGLVICVDLMGGSPFKEAINLAKLDDTIEVVVGINLPSLIEAVMLRQFSKSPKDLAKRAVESGKTAIQNVKNNDTFTL
ncbi:PTS sugar transporter subunit IIA [Bavariicoccus seileri]|uniref:PTS sugar transporter subunit IIA n=1 Tax=Bavariicoccus seileri TaxID=549685 RepID=UPI0003B362D1|nr:PTS sugar transporter subunit IIA [Bavariicoccus seileri]